MRINTKLSKLIEKRDSIKLTQEDLFSILEDKVTDMAQKVLSLEEEIEEEKKQSTPIYLQEGAITVEIWVYKNSVN